MRWKINYLNKIDKLSSDLYQECKLAQPNDDVSSTNDEDQPLVDQANTPAQQKIKDDRAAVVSRAVQKKRMVLDLKLWKVQQNQKAQQKFRDSKRKTAKEISLTYPEAAKRLRQHENSGRPPLETQSDMLEFYEAILDIVIPQSSADDMRQTEVYNSCQNLNALKKNLLNEATTLLGLPCIIGELLFWHLLNFIH